jgi:hypothetical protein
MSNRSPFDFSPSSSVVTRFHRQTGVPIGAEAGAHLTFPDLETAAGFINAGSDPQHADRPITVDYLSEVREAPTGDGNQYDAFVSHPDRTTGEVSMTLRHYGRSGLDAHAALSDFVVETATKITSSDADTDK